MSQETYKAFCERVGLPPGPEAAKAFVQHLLTAKEIKQHYDDIFIASLHSYGGNLAGFRGVGASEGDEQ